MIQLRTRLLCSFCLLLASAPAIAEHADHSKPVHLEADEVTIDDARQLSVFSGNVKLSQGSLVINGDQIVVVQDKTGFKYGTITGQLASFRQQRNGSDGYVEGNGERIEYDAKNEIMNIFGQGHVKRGSDDVHGDHITYNARTEVFQVSGTSETLANEKERRVHIVIQPHDTAASAPVSSEPLSIKPDTRLIKPKD